MNAKDFFGKFVSRYLWGHLLAMAAVVLLLGVGVKYGLELYTHHGEGIPVPNVKGMNYEKALRLLREDGLAIVVSDSGYNKRLPADCILAQTPGYGVRVKSGHTVYVTVNSPSSPTFTIPDLVDNSSVREAVAKLTAMGFRLLPPKKVKGEKDWVYGILSRGHHVAAGDRVSIETPLTLLVGDGRFDEDSPEIDYTEPEYTPDNSDVDEFQEVTEPPAETRKDNSATNN